MTMLPWWERWPGRLEHELAELERVGIPYECDAAAFEAGIVQLIVFPEIDGERHRLAVAFPDLYPDVRFEVYADDLELAHHQNPFAKNLCLIGRASENWRPSDTLAAFLCNQLPLVLRTGRSGDTAGAAGLEERQAEPFSDFYPYLEPAMISVDGGWSLDPRRLGGELLIGLEDKGPVLRGMVLEVRSGQDVLAHADDAIFERYSPDRRISGRWLRRSEVLREPDPKRFWDTITQDGFKGGNPKWQPVGRESVAVVGVVFPEEVEWRQIGDGWVFLVRVQRRRDELAHYFARSGYAGQIDLAARIPELAPLRTRRVVVVGLGALGMPSALAFARSGIAEIRAIDHDIVDPGIAARWPFGLSAAGHPKVAVLKGIIDAQYPYTKVRPYHHRLGAVQRYGMQKVGETDRSVIAEVLDGADLVYDATAEVGLHPMLDRLCRERGIPYVCVSATNGAWGGTVVRTRADAGCWHCFLASQDDGAIPNPIEAPSERIQPVGCASPTFSGAGFDLETIALAGTRLAVSTLTGAASGGYPDTSWDVAIVDLRDHAGQPIPPRWRTFPLTPRPGCPACGGT